MITETDLPKGEGLVVFDLNDGDTLKVERRGPDLFYGISDNFDLEENSAMMVAKLNKWGASVVGWE